MQSPLRLHSYEFEANMSEIEFAIALAKRINVSLDVPFLNETQEEAYILWVIRKAVPYIPPSIRLFVMDAADGIDTDELGRLEDVLVAVLNRYIDIPIVPESVEATLIRPVVGAVLDLARQGLSLDEPAAA